MSRCPGCNHTLQQTDIRTLISSDTAGDFRKDINRSNGVFGFSSSSSEHTRTVITRIERNLKEHGHVAYCEKCSYVVDHNGTEMHLTTALTRSVNLSNLNALTYNQRNGVGFRCTGCNKICFLFKRRTQVVDVTRDVHTTTYHRKSKWWGLSSSRRETHTHHHDEAHCDAVSFLEDTTCPQCKTLNSTGGTIVRQIGNIAIVPEAEKKTLLQGMVVPRAITAGPGPAISQVLLAAEKRREIQTIACRGKCALTPVRTKWLDFRFEATFKLPRDKEMLVTLSFLWIVLSVGTQYLWIIDRQYLFETLGVYIEEIKEVVDVVLPKETMNRREVYAFGAGVGNNFAILTSLRYILMAAHEKLQVTKLGHVTLNCPHHNKKFNTLVDTVGQALDRHLAGDTDAIIINREGRVHDDVASTEPPTEQLVPLPQTTEHPPHNVLDGHREVTASESHSVDVSKLWGVLGSKHHSVQHTQTLRQTVHEETRSVLPPSLQVQAALYGATTAARIGGRGHGHGADGGQTFRLTDQLLQMGFVECVVRTVIQSCKYSTPEALVTLCAGLQTLTEEYPDHPPADLCDALVSAKGNIESVRFCYGT